MHVPLEKVKTKGAQKKHMTKHQRLTKRDLSYWEYVDALHSMQNSNSSVKRAASSSEQPKRNMPMLKTLSMSKLMIIGDIVQLLPY